ncbi:hypothetical protein BY996DRAFT_4579179 [Phakopsora pachyrhizi]|uniref:Zn(2)-C6 fungal-type domain-containing protein n=1 Tax=Phakopsora pachyrhizi TaxID=170000 RepID=A0AAV0AU65_PHAPC|nr:hypothetical protein BY996DRAFT_4579179 [Phakopsora pachyrhizi]CAH7671802.1 hypothetical protein PPACK8108_LOCUS6619 [Phakopsora pachyrhizi]
MLGQHSHNSIQPYQQQLPTAPSQSPSARQDDHHNQPSSSSAASRSAPAATTKKKTLKRKLASCSGCRRRRTRCDRILPCSECLRRNSKCDYEGASLPPIAARRDLDDKSEREEYIKKLEDRVRTLESSNSHHPSPPDNSSSLPEIDFSADDIAFQLSKITLGQRLKSTLSRSAPVHPIQSQFQHLFSSGFTRTSTPFFEVDQSFTLDLVSATSSLSLSTLLSDYLPTRAQIDKLSKIYLESVNLWSPCINPISWTVLFNRFWAFPNRLSFRPNPESDQEGCNTYHQLAHFTACIFAINGHGLLRLADIHQLRPEGHGLSSPQPPGHNSNYPDPEFGNLSQSQKISLAHSWFKYAMGLLVGEEGQVFVKPTSFGIRAMALLGCVELAPENFDRAIFFWSLTCNSAAKAGLLNEPPVTEDENLDMVDEYELESRRHLSWFILSLDWAGATIAGDLRYRCDPCKYDVTIPGEIPSTFNEIDPNDGWPLDLITCMRKAAALSDRIMHRASLKFLSGNLATYKDVLETERSMLQLEESLPSRIQSVMSQDGKSLRPKVESDYFGLLISLFMAGRFSTSRVRLHRLFILPRPGVSAQERNRHMECKIYFFSLFLF